MAWAEETSPGRWRGRYTVVRGGRRVRLTVEHAGQTVIFTDRAGARREAAIKESEARRPGAVDARAGRVTWGQWQPVWWRRRRVEEGTSARDESRRRVHLEPKWASWPLDEITREHVQDWVDHLAARGDLAPATVRRIYHLMSASMKAAALDRKIGASPCVSIELPAEAPPDERFLSRDEVDAVCHFLDPKWQTLILILAGTGLRWGEAVALHWQRVHLDAGRIDVTMAWDAKRLRYKLPKDHERRSVPVLDWVESTLLHHRKMFPPGTVCGAEHPAAVGRCSSSLIIPGRTGGPPSYNSFEKGPWKVAVGRWVWVTPNGREYGSPAAARKVAGEEVELSREWQPGAAGIAPCTIHDLRHTFASWFLADGGDIYELSRILGHASVKTTERYSHLSPEQWKRTRERMAGRGPRAGRAPETPHFDLRNVRELPRRAL